MLNPKDLIGGYIVIKPIRLSWQGHALGIMKHTGSRCDLPLHAQAVRRQEHDKDIREAICELLVTF